MKMITNSFEGLRRYGINPLTGEACAYGQRVLCDLTDYGKEIVFDLLGIPRDSRLPENWNSGAHHSMMIPRSLLEHDLPIWCLFEAHRCSEVIVSHDGICGRDPDDTDEEWERYYDTLVRFDKNPRRIRSKAGPRQGSRMVHALTGRSA
jgi:hypothetical protein